MPRFVNFSHFPALVDLLYLNWITARTVALNLQTIVNVRNLRQRSPSSDHFLILSNSRIFRQVCIYFWFIEHFC